MTMDFPYPQRPGEPDCAYYMKTGLCAFGMDCRFNHPPDRNLASGMDRSREEYPERIGQPDCQYYLKTGTCKFGSSCKFHHPRDKAGSSGRRQLNSVNLPLRPGEKDCAFYMRTGTCKFGTSCKFNHPQPLGTVGAAAGLMSTPSSSTFPGGETRSPIPAAQLYPLGYNPAWQVTASRPPLIPSPPTQASFSPMVLPTLQSFVQFPPGWSTYQGPGPFGPMDAQQQAAMQQATYLYGAAPAMPSPQDPLALNFPQAAPAYSPYMAGTPAAAVAFSMPSTSGSRESTYPERPGQPECQYYMKTGECRFGSTCRFHHPKERNPDLALVLGPTGLPLRPGAPPCTFYNRHGFCKFGSNCKFDHPFSGSPYSLSVSSFGEMPMHSSITMPSASSGQGEQFQSRRRGGQPAGNIPLATIDGGSGQDISTQSSDVGSRTLLGRSTSHPS